MSLLLRKDASPSDNLLAFVTDAEAPARPAKVQHTALGFAKKCSVSVMIFVAIIATSGWLYLIAKAIGAFIRWL